MRAAAAVLWAVPLALAACADAPTISKAALVVAPPDTGTPDAPLDYQTMCRNYCHDLDQTVFYACLGSGGSPDDCADRVAGAADQCFQARCVPQLVEPSLCLHQCDSLATFYDPVCGAEAAAPPELCPALPAAHDATCRAGCAFGTP